MQYLISPSHWDFRTRHARKSLLKSWVLACASLVLLTSSSLFAQASSGPTYPALSTFLWGNTSVNAVGKTSFVSGTGYGYRYIVPQNFNPTTKYPVIIFLCGEGELGTDNQLQLTVNNNTGHGVLSLVSTANPNNQANYPCFFIAPQAPVGETWSDDNAATAIQNLLTIFETQYPNSFDTSRIYLTGLSLGGMGAYDLPYVISQSNHLGYNPFAATAPMSGQLGYYSGRAPSTEPNMAIWAFHGVEDTNYPIATTDDVDVPALRAAGFSVAYSRYATATHDIWEVAYQEPQLLPWFFAQRLGTPTQALSNYAITTSSQTTTPTTLSISGTASTAEGFTGISWNNTVTGGTGSVSGAINPTWSVTNLPISVSPNLIQFTAQAPNNGAYVNGVFTNYGGTMTDNLPFTSTASLPNVALNQPVTVSSIDSTGHAGSYAVDGNTTTRWSSLYSDDQWIVVDLGQQYDISEIDLTWETACGENYLIQTSPDDVNWTTQTTVIGNTATGLLPYFYPTPVTGRYVRMYGLNRATPWGYSLFEFAVYGTASSDQPPPPPPISNLALNKPVTVSSVDSTAHAGSFAVDGDTTTRWSSAYSDPQWIVVDLGADYAITEVDLTWETACGSNYLIQTSLDDINWTTQTTVTGNTSSGLLTYPYASPPTGRYVRMFGTARATAWGYSLYEFAVYGTTPSSGTPPPPVVTDLALNQPVTVSSVDSPGHAGIYAVDGNLTTRWSSSYTDNEWIVVDLGANHSISEIDLDWETACGKNYLIQTSTDGVTWTTQTTVTGNSTTGLLPYLYATPVTGRYIRMLGTARATVWGYSLYEISVYGQ